MGIVLKKGNADNRALYEPMHFFEKKLAKHAGVRRAFAVASGTDALILSLRTLGIGPGDEVVVPAVSFFSTASAVMWVGAKPVFVDVELDTFNIDVSKIESVITLRTKAIIPVHLNGRMADMDVILSMAKKHSLAVIVDAAHAVGSRYMGNPVGVYGDLVCLSFNFTKLFGGYGNGGAVLTDSDGFYDTIFRMRMYGAPSWKELHTNNTIVGVSSRLDPFEAAILIEKFPYLESYIARQREHCGMYRELLGGVGDIRFLKDDPRYEINGYRFPILTKQKNGLDGFLRERGIRPGNYYPVPLPYLPALQSLGYQKGDFPVAEKIAEESLMAPTHYSLTKKDIIKIVDAVKRFFARDSV